MSARNVGLSVRRADSAAYTTRNQVDNLYTRPAPQQSGVRLRAWLVLREVWSRLSVHGPLCVQIIYLLRD